MTVQERRINLKFGTESQWHIDVSEGVTTFLDPQVEPLLDIESAVQTALETPIEFPSIDQALVPGDTLVLAVDPVLPAQAQIIPAAVQWFIQRGTTPANVCVVIAGSHSEAESSLSESLRREIESKLGPQAGAEVQIELHNPDDPNQIAYVAANDDAEPIYMNRTLVDADVVIPITCCRPKHALDYLGAYGIYPLLSDRATRGSFYDLTRLVDDHDHLTAWADQAAMWAGFMVEMQVIPAGGNQVGGILAGLTEPLERASTLKMNDAWKTPVHTSDLTVALLDGGACHQNWLGISRALHVASQCTRDGGAIVVCTDAKSAVGKSLGRLRKAQLADTQLQEKLAKDASDDTIAAAMIHRTTADKHVYLVSDLRDETVESLGLGVVKNAEELSHLMAQFESTIVLGSAQHREISLLS